jgi:hypothetical protein
MVQALGVFSQNFLKRVPAEVVKEQATTHIN